MALVNYSKGGGRKQQSESVMSQQDFEKARKVFMTDYGVQMDTYMEANGIRYNENKGVLVYDGSAQMANKDGKTIGVHNSKKGIETIEAVSKGVELPENQFVDIYKQVYGSEIPEEQIMQAYRPSQPKKAAPGQIIPARSGEALPFSTGKIETKMNPASDVVDVMVKPTTEEKRVESATTKSMEKNPSTPKASLSEYGIPLSRKTSLAGKKAKAK